MSRVRVSVTHCDENGVMGETWLELQGCLYFLSGSWGLFSKYVVVSLIHALISDFGAKSKSSGGEYMYPGNDFFVILRSFVTFDDFGL